MRWDDLPEVRSPVGRSIAELLQQRPRVQDLPGFEPIYSDFVDYIIRCTHRIWEEKNVGLCRTHYGADCRMHTLAGPTVGAEAVVQNTVSALAASADRLVIGEDVIWSDDPDGRLYSSHRIMSRSTHMGDDPLLGRASMHGAGVMTIADCACRENRIVEEWLVRDNLRAVWQVGLDPWHVAGQFAALDREGNQERHGWRAEWIARTREEPDCPIPEDHPAALSACALGLAWREDLYGEAAALASPAVELRWPSNRRGYGRGFMAGCLGQLAAVLHQRAFRVEHVVARPLPDGDIAVAVRWALTGWHRSGGAWGPATGRELLLVGVSHHWLRSGLIIEDATVFDELQVLRQLVGGLGA